MGGLAPVVIACLFPIWVGQFLGCDCTPLRLIYPLRPLGPSLVVLCDVNLAPEAHCYPSTAQTSRTRTKAASIASRLPSEPHPRPRLVAYYKSHGAYSIEC